MDRRELLNTVSGGIESFARSALERRANKYLDLTRVGLLLTFALSSVQKAARQSCDQMLTPW